jgi:hypothetical protein
MANLAFSTTTVTITAQDADAARLEAIILAALPPRVRMLDLALADTPPKQALAGATPAVLDPSRIEALPPADGALVIGALPKLAAAAASGTGMRPAAVIEALLRRHDFVIVDLPAAPDLASETLAAAAVCFKLGLWEIAGGPRLIVKLVRERPDPKGLKPLRIYRRNHASWPADKRLLDEAQGDPSRPAGQVAGGAAGDVAGHLADHVRFSIARAPSGDLVWLKTYENPDGARLAALEAEIAAAAEAALRQLRSMQPRRADAVRLVRPFHVDGPTLLFPYGPDLFAAQPSHGRDWCLFLSADQQRTIALMAGMTVSFRGLPNVFLHNLCDFQVAHGWDGLNLLDFEPNPWVCQLVRD